MGKLLEMARAVREERKKQKAANAEMQRQAVNEARAAYGKEYIAAAKTAVKTRAKREAMARFGYSKAQRRQQAVSNLTKELGSLGDWGVGNKPAAVKRTTHKAHKKTAYKQRKPLQKKNPFDLGNINDFDMNDIF